MENMTDQEQSNTQSSAILRELSDIKSTLAVNTNETVNIKERLAGMQNDVKDIKNDYPSRRELNEALAAVRTTMPDVKPLDSRITNLETKMNRFLGALVICQVIILPVIMYLFYKALN